ncbi:nuclease [Pseudidiomarina salinarum]|uniref:Nuclease n=1 Tax=Pseudidiomarina salinarum TaxID=435908 RepID=A0A094ISH8_9GAMM|nr:nuclease-related domain-containing protein [Pseudidiomarina salinarum]KFZ30645.1 nuclease [Pseudidiomarina salinarum]RUO69156.1 NERD domain-containing protein [Pseudidiomarina salinarum]
MKKSPLKSKPLNNPGESLEKRLIDIVFDDILFFFIVAIVVFVLALMEWYRWYFETLPNPILMSVLAAIVVVIAGWKVVRGFRAANAVKLGIAGEKAVGQFLERLRIKGAQVFHDVEGENFNLDHVVIHRSGIYVVETKMMSKPAKGKAELDFDGVQIKYRGKAIMGDPVTQVNAASYWLAELLSESTGRKLPVRGVVVYPGWYINTSDAGSRTKVWVLNPKALPAYIENQPEQIPAEDIYLCAYHLSRYIRTK